MPRGLNKVSLIGNLGRDVEAKYTQAGTMVATFSLAVSRRTKEGQEETDWLRCVAWDKLGETCNEYLRKGSKCYVEGRIRTYKYQKDGAEVNAFEIVVTEMILLDQKGEGTSNGREAAGAVRPVRTLNLPGVGTVTESDDSDLPF